MTDVAARSDEAAGRGQDAVERGTGTAQAAATGTGPGRYRWRRDADVVVVGSGAAGISVALTAAARGLRVLVVTKDLVGGATPMAQGGLAAALGAGDSPVTHASDTLTAGAGLCEPDVVAELTAAAPGTIDWLTGLGAQLETRDLRLEGGHSAHRIVHSGDDATGAEVHRALLTALLASDVEILDRTVALDLLAGETGGGRAAPSGAVRGIELADGDGAGTGTGAGASARAETAAATAGPRGALVREPVPAHAVAGLAAAFIEADGRLTRGVISARAVVIAAGGLGQAFGTTSNPAGATGDGIAIAARAGAVLRDLEFVQFHPTVLWLPDAAGQCPLVTEALRGAGAVLREADGTPLMAGHDPRGDLAPRDVVAARMAEVIGRGSADAGHVWLDATGLGRDLLEDGFPTVTAACRKHGIDPVTDYIPVAPGAHYSCGGILADLDGRTTLSGLYAVGEAASTGVQGANRLASNSVTEAIIGGRRAGEAIATAVAEGAITAAMTGDGCGNGPVIGGPLPQPSGWTAAVGAAWAAPAAEADAAGADGDAAGADGDAAGADGDAAGADGDAAGAAWAAAVRAVLAGAGRRAGVSRDGMEARRDLAAAMSRYAGVIRDAGGLGRLLLVIAGADAADGPGGRQALEVSGAVREEHALVRDEGVELEAVEAANLRTVSLLIAAGAARRTESRGCHRRRDAGATGDTPWHTLLCWDGRELLVTEEKM
jgi:L-aspartate oxidase